MKNWQLSLLLLFFIQNSFQLFGQNFQKAKEEISSLISPNNRNFYQLNINVFSKKIKSILDTVSNNHFELRTGKVYAAYPTISGHPFLFENELKGELSYNNTIYKDFGLLYNIYDDELICLMKQKNWIYSTILNSDLVHSFRISDKTFFKYPMNRNLSGFYELIYQNDSIHLLAKWQKSVYLNNESKDFFSPPERKLFVLNNEEVIKIKKKKDLLSVFKLSKFPKKNGRKIKIPKLKDASNNELVEILTLLLLN